MLTVLANRNPDIGQLRDKGFALRYDAGYLVVRDIPYLDGALALQWGAIVSKLVWLDQEHVRQENHQVFFAGGTPHGLDGRPIPNLGDSTAVLALGKPDIVVERTFSNKPRDAAGQFLDYPDHFAKISHYMRLISGPAIEKFNVSPYTFRIDEDEITNSVFKFQDTLTSRAEIGDLSALFKDEVVALIGLGGTGAYVLDFLVKTPVTAIRGFDDDSYYVHNAYRSPGRLDAAEFRRPKAAIYQARYENFRHGLTLKQQRITADSAVELESVTFAFVCVDKGTARKEIIDLLISRGIPFIDVGLGLKRCDGRLTGAVRTTFFAAGDPTQVRGMGLVETADHPDDEYKVNIQIGELNALNAALAVIRYKAHKGFYGGDDALIQTAFDIAQTKAFSLP
jgi:hypothetical protein